MNNNKKDFVSLLQDICEMYEKYISKNADSRLKVLVQDNKINISLYNDDIVDMVELSFNEKEKDIYLYLSVIIMKILFGNNIMYNKDNMFYNDDKPYLEIFVNDMDMLNKIFNVMIMSRKINIYQNVDAVNKKVYVRKLEEKINFSRKLLGMDGNQ